MSDTVYHCDLCHLPVEVNGFTIQSSQGEKRFCCEGCKGIYLMLHGDGEDNQATQPPDHTTRGRTTQ